ncbi:MAG: hypothetical protein DME26_07800 [Verrucomicrobia bacterium]|nr:MAG: hypothetical protein DME26_07800 [Verrucomicrobiota bacterium]
MNADRKVCPQRKEAEAQPEASSSSPTFWGTRFRFSICVHTLLWVTTGLQLTRAAEDKPVVSFELAGGANKAEAVVFSRDLKWLATRWPSGKVQVWDVGKGESVAEWPTEGKEEDDPLLLLNRQAQIAFIPNSPQLLVAAATNLAIHEILTGKVVRIFEPSPRPITGIALSPSGDRVVGFLADPLPAQLLFWSLADAKQLSALPTKRAAWESPYAGRRRQPGGNIRPPASIVAGITRAFSQDGRLFAVGLEYAQIDLWNLETGKWLDTLQDSGRYGLSSSGRVTSLGFLAAQRLAVVFNSLELSVLERNTNASATLLRYPQMSDSDSLEIRSLVVSGDGNRLAVAGMRMGRRQGFAQPAGTFVFDVPMHGEVQVWDAVGMELVATLKGRPDEKFSRVALDDTGQRVATVTTGVEYHSSMTGAMQQSEELTVKRSLRVCVWNVPSPAP